MTDRDRAERQILEVLDRLRTEYEKAAKPYIDMLYTLRSMGRQPALIVSYDQAKGLGLELVEEIRAAAEIGKAM